jgi:prevent-host-death family protein
MVRIVPVTDVTLVDAKTYLSELVNRVEAGEEVRITRRGKPVAKLISIKAKQPEIDIIPGLAKTDSSPPLRSGGGGPREAWWRGRSLYAPSVTPLRGAPPPPCRVPRNRGGEGRYGSIFTRAGITALRTVTDKLEFQAESAGDFVRRMRDDDSY